MTSRRRSLRALAALCDEIGPEDGVDPRHTRRGSSRKHDIDRKTFQLRGQVTTALELAWASLADAELEQLRVVRVEPAPDSSRFLVVWGPASEEDPPTEEEALETLGRAAGKLRHAVAASIHRKRVPELAHVYVPHAGEQDPGRIT